jgi:hypothetical protein
MTMARWLADAIRERVRAGSWNPRPQHDRDAWGAPASRAVATSRLQGCMRATARPLQTTRWEGGCLGPSTGGPLAARGSRQQQQGGAGERRRHSLVGLVGEGLGAVAGRCCLVEAVQDAWL